MPVSWWKPPCVHILLKYVDACRFVKRIIAFVLFYWKYENLHSNFDWKNFYLDYDSLLPLPRCTSCTPPQRPTFLADYMTYTPTKQFTPLTHHSVSSSLTHRSVSSLPYISPTVPLLLAGAPAPVPLTSNGWGAPLPVQPFWQLGKCGNLTWWQRPSPSHQLEAQVTKS